MRAGSFEVSNCTKESTQVALAGIGGSGSSKSWTLHPGVVTLRPVLDGWMAMEICRVRAIAEPRASLPSHLASPGGEVAFVRKILG